MALPQIVDSKSTILVLDDDVAVLGSLQFLLETHGFAVSTFQSPVAMLDWARVNAFDCVVVDYKMPDFDGLQVAAQLRERGVTAPVILVTGIRQVLLKPHIEDSLVARIQELSLGAPALQGQPDPGADLRKHT
jgi:two-component system response regulator FixJ